MKKRSRAFSNLTPAPASSPRGGRSTPAHRPGCRGPSPGSDPGTCGVGGADHRPVGEADVVQLRSPTAARSRSRSRATLAVLMWGGAFRCWPGRPARSPASRPRRQQGRWCRGVRRRTRRRSAQRPTVDGGTTGPHTPRVEADEVEAAQRFEGDRRRGADEVHAGAARPTGIGEQRADAVGLVEAGMRISASSMVSPRGRRGRAGQRR